MSKKLALLLDLLRPYINLSFFLQSKTFRLLFSGERKRKAFRVKISIHAIFPDFFLVFFFLRLFFNDLRVSKLVVDTLTSYRHAYNTNLFFFLCLLEIGFAVAIDFFSCDDLGGGAVCFVSSSASDDCGGKGW